MRRIAVIDGHPDASEMHLDHALAGHYAQAAREAGADVRRIDIAALEIPVLHKPDDFYRGEAPESLKEAQRDIRWADHLMFVYPLWHGTMPAHMKAFVEQVFRPGFAMDYNGNGRFPKQLFKGKSAAVVVTMGMPAFIYRAYFGAHGVKSFERSVLTMCGISPVSEMLLGGAGGNCEGRTRKWKTFAFHGWCAAR